MVGKVSGTFGIKGATDNTKIGNIGDSLKTSSTSFNGALTQDVFLEIARGNITGVKAINKFGHNANVGNVNFEDIWHGGDDYPFSVSAEKVNISSTSALDTSAGTGARTIRLFGLDSNYNEISETVTLNGTTNVVSTNSYLRLQRATVITAGSGGENAGDITGIQQTSTDKLFDMPESQNQTQSAAWTVPAGYTFYLISWFLGLSTTQATNLTISVRPFNEVFQVKRRLSITESMPQWWEPYLEISEKSDIRIRAKTSTGSNDVSSGFDGILVEN